MNNNKPDLTTFCFSINWLEKYIEVKELLPNWPSRKQTDTSVIRRNWDKNTPESEIISTLGTSLHISCACSENWPDKVSDEKRKAYKTEFYKWIDATEINVNECPPNLKIVIFAFHEVCKDKAGGLKIHQEAENAKRELDPDSPEYKEQLQKTFSAIYEAHASGKAYEVNEIQLNGSPEAGKKTFETIANSISVSEKESFHFWPQENDSEKAKDYQKKVNSKLDQHISSKSASKKEPNTTQIILIISGTLVGLGLIITFIFWNNKKNEPKRK